MDLSLLGTIRLVVDLHLRIVMVTIQHPRVATVTWSQGRLATREVNKQADTTYDLTQSPN